MARKQTARERDSFIARAVWKARGRRTDRDSDDDTARNPVAERIRFVHRERVGRAPEDVNDRGVRRGDSDAVLRAIDAELRQREVSSDPVPVDPDVVRRYLMSQA